MTILNSAKDITKYIHNNARILVGGFLGVGTPEGFIDAILGHTTTDLEAVVCDTAFPDKGIGKLISAKRIKKLYTSHIGTNPETGRQFNEKTMEIEFIPQGTLIERLRAAGAGLGGILTGTGIGTTVAEGKQIITLNSVDYLLEEALPGDFALIRAYKADRIGNLVYYGSTRNFNPIMATAAKTVFAEVDEIVDELDPEVIITPGPIVDYIALSTQYAPQE